MSVMQKIKDIEDEVYHPVSTVTMPPVLDFCIQSWILSCPPRFNLAYAARSQTGLEALEQRHTLKADLCCRWPGLRRTKPHLRIWALSR